MSNAAPTPERILQIAWSFAPPLVVEAAVRHRVFDVLARQPYAFEEIAGWLTEAGFVNPRLLPAPGPSPLILATACG